MSLLCWEEGFSAHEAQYYPESLRIVLVTQLKQTTITMTKLRLYESIGGLGGCFDKRYNAS